ncbi:MAG: NAD(P)H-dependent oxidoreductase [Acidimicrobiales bacterium]
MKALVVYAHPDEASFSAALRDVVCTSLRQAGHQVHLLDLYAEDFEPALSAEELATHAQGLAARPAIASHAELLATSDALVLVHPTWWGGPPAMLKGWFDRVFCEGVAFTLPPESTRVRPLLRHVQHLVVVTTYGSPRWINALQGEPGRRMVRWGLRSLLARRARVRWLALYDMDRNHDARRQAFLDQVAAELANLDRPRRAQLARLARAGRG